MKINFFIMAGGSGTRFWPLSTKDMPKQFLQIFDKKSLLELTINRISEHFDKNNIFILTNKTYVEYIMQNYNILKENIIGEAYPKDTAASTAIAVYHSLKQDRDSICVLLPADHIIETPQDFYNDLNTIFNYCNDYKGIFTIGIKPSYPSTGFGYLEIGDDINSAVLSKVISFKEKPDIKKAREYLEAEKFFWNSGIFVFKASNMAEYIDTYLPQHTKINEALSDERASEALDKILYELPKISIDYGIMEKIEDIYTIPASFSWNDMGSWLSLKDYLDYDNSSNYKNLPIHQLDSKNNLIYSKDQNEEIVLAGVNDLIVVRADNKTLILHKDRVEDLKTITQDL